MKQKLTKSSLNTLTSLTIVAKKQNHQQQNFSQKHKPKQNNEPQITLSSSDHSQVPVLSAVLQMKFRKQRGTRIKQLMSKKFGKNDTFWMKNQRYFGGNLNFSEDQGSQIDEDYEESSQGIDSFDSDFGDDIKWKRNESKTEDREDQQQFMQNQNNSVSQISQKSKKNQFKQKKKRKSVQNNKKQQQAKQRY